MRVFRKLLNNKTKGFFETVTCSVPCSGEHGPCIEVRVFDLLLNNKTKRLNLAVLCSGFGGARTSTK